MKSGYLLAVGTAGGGTARAAHAAIITASPTASALIRINTILLRRRGGQPFDESSGHIRFDDDLAVRGDVADDTRHAVQPRDLLAIEVGATVERNRNAPGVERKPGRHHLQQLAKALPCPGRDERRPGIGSLQSAL